MSGTIGAGLPVVEPDIQTQFSIFLRSLKTNFHSCKIGTIQSFDPTTRTATIALNFQRQMIDGSYKSYPPLTDCPVFTLQGGGYSMQFPIAAGDSCLVVFADKNIDNWFSTGGTLPPATGRQHSLSDGFALVGINWSGDGKIPAYSTTEARFGDNAGTKVGISNEKITVQNAAQNLATILANLMTALENLTVVVSGSSGTVNPTSVAQLKAVAEDLAALLY